MPEYGETFQFNLFCNKCMICLQHVESMDTLLSVVKAYQVILDKSSVVAETSSKASGLNVGTHSGFSMQYTWETSLASHLLHLDADVVASCTGTTLRLTPLRNTIAVSLQCLILTS